MQYNQFIIVFMFRVRLAFLTGKYLELYSTIEAPAESARRLVTMMPGAESNQHSVTSSVLACLAHR